MNLNGRLESPLSALYTRSIVEGPKAEERRPYRVIALSSDSFEGKRLSLKVPHFDRLSGKESLHPSYSEHFQEKWPARERASSRAYKLATSQLSVVGKGPSDAGFSDSGISSEGFIRGFSACDFEKKPRPYIDEIEQSIGRKAITSKKVLRATCEYLPKKGELFTFSSTPGAGASRCLDSRDSSKLAGCEGGVITSKARWQPLKKEFHVSRRTAYLTDFRKDELEGADLKASSSLFDIQSRDDVQLVMTPSTEESFLASSYPFSRSSYWTLICQKRCQIGLQFESGLSYHMESHDSMVLPGFTIRLLSKRQESTLTYRVYEITDLCSGTALHFNHMSLDWPDRALPKERDFLELMLEYSSRLKGLEAPRTHVHCRAGHGRTGTFIFTRVLLSNPDVPIEVLLRALRSQRKLVDTISQKEFAIRMAQQVSKMEE